MKGLNFHYKLTNKSLLATRGDPTLRVGAVKVFLELAEKERAARASGEVKVYPLIFKMRYNSAM